MKTIKHTYAAKLINKYMILWAGIIHKRIDCSQSISMNFIINHSLHRITENLNRKSRFIAETLIHELWICQIEGIHKCRTYFVNLIYEDAKICCLWIITTQIWMASFHATIIGFLYLFWRGIRKLVTKAKEQIEN